MAEKIEKAPEMSKEELVHAVAIMLSCQDMPAQINKLDKKCLFRLFDGFQFRGQAFATLEEKLRDAERKINEQSTEIAVLTNKLKKSQRDLKNKGNHSNGRRTRNHRKQAEFCQNYGNKQPINTAMADALKGAK